MTAGKEPKTKKGLRRTMLEERKAIGGNLTGGEVLEKVVVHDGLLDEGLGPEVLAVLLCVGGEGGGHALAGHALLLAQRQLTRHAVRILRQKSLLKVLSHQIR
jgi:hypothetical protein